MKVNLSRKLRKLGSALLTTLVICSILSMFVMYYLSLIEQQNHLSVRSQAWNMAMAVTEAGIEDGLEQLNNNATNLTADGYSQVSSGIYSRTNTMPDLNSYTVTIYVTNSPQFVNGVLNKPLVIAQGNVVMPALAQNAFASTLFAAIGINGGSASQPTLTRAVKVTASKPNLYVNGLSARTFIDLHGNGVYTDSYNSQDPAKSTNGRYDSSKYTGDHGDIACNNGVVNTTISIQNADIYGHCHTGPGGTVTVGSNGGVGAHAWRASNNGFEPGWVVQDANFSFPDTSAPQGAGSWLGVSPGWVILGTPAGTCSTNSVAPTPTPTGLTNYPAGTSSTYPGQVPGLTTNLVTSPVTSGSYPPPGSYVGTITTNNSGQGSHTYTFNKITGLSYSYPTFYVWPNYNYSTNYYNGVFQDGAPNYGNYSTLGATNLVIGTNINLYLAGGLPTTNYWIKYAQFGSTVQLSQYGTNWGPVINITQYPHLLVYAGGSTVKVPGNNIVNPDGLPVNFTVFCAPSVTSFSLSGNGTFTGVLVAPNADMSLNGGGNNNQDFSGSIMCNSVTMNGHFSFHYDEALMSPPNAGRYLATTWTEIKPH